MYAFGHQLSGLGQQLFTIPPKPLLSVKVHPFLPFPLGGDHLAGAGAIAAVVDVDVAGVEVEVSKTLMAKGICLVSLHNLIFNKSPLAKMRRIKTKMIHSIKVYSLMAGYP